MTETPLTIQTYIDPAMTEPKIFPLAGGEVVVIATRAPARPSPSEDAAAVLAWGDRQGLLVVADGFGGHPGGHEAARLAIGAVTASVEEVLREALRAADAGVATSALSVPLQAAIVAGFDRANAAVRDLGIGAATTLVAVEIADRVIRPYHVGDSEVLVTGQRGRVKLRTLSHSPVGYAVEAGLVDPESALHLADRNIVSNMVGSPEMRIEVGAPLALAPRDTVLVGTDGLFDNLSEEEIVASGRAGALPTGIATLAAAAHARMVDPRPGQPSKPDDLTLIGFRPQVRGRHGRTRTSSGENRKDP